MHIRIYSYIRVCVRAYQNIYIQPYTSHSNKYGSLTYVLILQRILHDDDLHNVVFIHTGTINLNHKTQLSIYRNLKPNVNKNKATSIYKQATVSQIRFCR